MTTTTSTSIHFNHLQAARDAIHQLAPSHLPVTVGLVLGSGLNNFSKQLRNATTIPYSKIPHMPMTAVAGHAGELVLGELPVNGGKSTVRVMCFAGRVHAYEAHPPTVVTFLVRLAYHCGCSTMVLTNAAGGALHGMIPGSCMVLNDHIRFCAFDGIADVSDDARMVHSDRRYVDSKSLYDSELQQLLLNAGKKLDMSVLSGSYTWTGGPTYETPSEVKAGMLLGGGAFGMSTVPEAMAAYALHMKVVAVSLCTNLAAGLSDEVLTHDDVKHAAAAAGPAFEKLLLQFFSDMNDTHLQSSQSAIGSSTLPSDSTASSDLQSSHNSTDTPVAFSSADIAQCCKAITDSSEQALAPSVALFLHGNEITDAVLSDSKWHASRTIQLNTLPYFAQRTNSSAVALGRLILASYGTDFQAAIIATPSLEGFRAIESSFLVQALALAGLQSVLSATRASPLQSTGSGQHAVHSISDVLDLSMDILPSPDKLAAFRQRTSYSLTSASATSGATYAAWRGPALPSQSETHIASLAVAESVGLLGITNPSPLAAALSVACTASAWVGTTEDISKPLDKQTAIQVAAALLADAKAKAAAGKSKAHADLDRLIAQSWQQPAAAQGLPAEAGYEQAQASADALRHALAKRAQGSPTTAVFIDGALHQIAQQFSILAAVDVAELPHWQYYVGQAQYPDNAEHATHWQFSLAKTRSSEQLVLLLHPTKTAIAASPPALQGVEFAVRMLKTMSIQRLVLLSSLTAVNADLSIGSVCAVTDHVNLSGYNPLVGHNDERFGPRFPDCSNIYTPALIETASTSQLHRTITAITSTSFTHSPALAQLLKTVNATTVTQHTAQCAIVARHCSIEVAWLAYVGSNTTIKQGQLHTPPSTTIIDTLTTHLTAVLTT